MARQLTVVSTVNSQSSDFYVYNLNQGHSVSAKEFIKTCRVESPTIRTACKGLVAIAKTLKDLHGQGWSVRSMDTTSVKIVEKRKGNVSQKK